MHITGEKIEMTCNEKALDKTILVFEPQAAFYTPQVVFSSLTDVCPNYVTVQWFNGQMFVFL